MVENFIHLESTLELCPQILDDVEIRYFCRPISKETKAMFSEQILHPITMRPVDWAVILNNDGIDAF